MSQLIRFEPFLKRDWAPTLVLVDLQEEFQRDRAWADESLRAALANCRAILDQMRTMGGPVAFVRRADLDSSQWSTRWIGGFIPTRDEMVFERKHPSCYASASFAQMAERTNGDFVLAGLFSESACLATAFDAHERGHRPTFLADSSTSRAAGELSSAEVHHAVTAIIGLYADIVTTRAWIDLVLGGPVQSEWSATTQEPFR